MSKALEVLLSSLKSGQRLFTPPRTDSRDDLTSESGSRLVPIRTLGNRQRRAVLRHLLELDTGDRYLRFGYVASDEQIAKYVQTLDFEKDAVYGVYDRRLKLLAVAHVAFAKGYGYDMCAEFGVSVLPHGRRRGLGAQLFQRAATHAANEGVRMMFIHALTENTGMLKIAKQSGARLEHDGPETQAYLSLPEPTMDSRFTELLQDRVGQTDYALKVQARQFWDLLAHLQALRAETLDAQTKSPP